MRLFLKRIRKIVLWLLGIILVLSVVFHRLLFDLGKVLYGAYTINSIADKLEYKEVTLTKDQMIEDLDYLYGAAVENTLTTEYAEKYYDVDYDQIYDTFKERILNCKDEYEFTALMIALDAKLPGGHSAIEAPLDKPKSDFPMGELTDKETWNINYSLCRQFEDRMGEYDQKGAVAIYYDGDYVFEDFAFGNFDTVDGINHSRLLSLNGKKVSDVVTKLDTFYHLSYDESAGSAFVSTIIFNDGIGEKYDAEIQLPDKTIIHKDLYISPEYNMAYYYRSRRYPDHYKKSDSESDKKSQLSYSIETDPDRKLVYARFTECRSDENEQLKGDLRQALEDVDAENVILDFRNNSGGEFNYVTEGVLATVLDHDVVHINTAIAKENDFAKDFYHNKFEALLANITKSGDTYYVNEDFSVKGTADKSYNIYALVNHGTFSSGDIFAYLAKKDGITLIGQNTGGDGLSGNPLQSYLPNSRLQFTFVCSKSEAFPEDCYAGVSPDYFEKTDWDDVLEINDMFSDIKSGEHKKYENRQKWDDCLIKALELIDANGSV